VFRGTWYGWRDYHSVKILNPKGNYSTRELNWVSSEAALLLVSKFSDLFRTHVCILMQNGPFYAADVCVCEGVRVSVCVCVCA
jgi:hypothetical protein